jgi:hypothetical protein
MVNRPTEIYKSTQAALFTPDGCRSFDNLFCYQIRYTSDLKHCRASAVICDALLRAGESDGAGLPRGG